MVNWPASPRVAGVTVGAGDQFQQAQHAASVDGQALHLVALELAAGGGIFALQHGRGSVDDDALVHAAHLQGEIGACGNGGGQSQVESDGLAKAVASNSDLVRTRFEGCDGVSAAWLGDGGAAKAGFLIDHSDGGVADAAFGSVQNTAVEVRVSLCMGGRHTQSTENQEGCQTA